MAGYVGSKAVILSTTAADVAGDAEIGGNIVVDGTVDGRDVAADGAKLDGIEANANVTDTANVTAAGALMDSELTSEASVKALDQGVATTDSPSFVGLTADQYNNDESLPDVRPSLLLDFANSKTLDPRITFTRGSTATYWDGKTTAKAEENLFKYSQELDTSSYWNPIRLDITGDAATAPDGTTTATQLNQASGETTGGRIAALSGNNPISSGNEYTFSVYAKPNGKGFLRINFSNDQMYYNISSGTLGTTPSSVTASIEDAGNGWYRCIGTWTAGNSNPLYMHVADADNSQTVTDDQQGIYLWGAQLEQRSSATAYTATTTSPIVKYQPVLQTAASGEARFDHDPVTGESKGLLIEEARTNYVTYSEDFDQWTAPTAPTAATVTDDIIVSPDGNITGAKVDFTAADNHPVFITASVSLANGADMTNSLFVKYGGGNLTSYKVQTFSQGTSNLDGYAVITFNSSGEITNVTTETNVTSVGYEDVGNGWYRVHAVQNNTTGGTQTSMRLSIGRGSSDTGFIYVWGGQVEAGSFPTSYIPTSGSTVTRSVDSALINGNNFSSFFSQSGFTLYRDVTAGWDMLRSPSASAQTRIANDSYGNAINLRVVTDTSTPQLDVYMQSFGSASVDSSDNNNISNLSSFKQVLSVDPESLLSNATGGGASGVDTSVVLANDYSQLVIDASPDRYWYGKIAFYPKKFTDATLQAMMQD